MSKYLPEFENQKILKDGELVDPQSPMTVEQLMSHSAGLAYGFYDDNPVDLAYQEAGIENSRDLDEFIDSLAELPLRFEPGSRYQYSGIGTDVAARVAEVASGMTRNELLQTELAIKNIEFFGRPFANRQAGCLRSVVPQVGVAKYLISAKLQGEI